MENLNIKNSYKLHDYASISRDDEILELLCSFRQDVFQELDLVKKLLKSLQTSIGNSTNIYTEGTNNDNDLSIREQCNSLAESSSGVTQDMTFETKEQLDIPMYNKCITTVKEEFLKEVAEDWNVAHGVDESNMKTIVPCGINSICTVGLSSTSESLECDQQSTNEPHAKMLGIIVEDSSIEKFELRPQNLRKDNEIAELMNDTSLQSSLDVSVSSAAIEKCHFCNEKIDSNSQLEEHLTLHDKGNCQDINDMIEFIGSEIKFASKPFNHKRKKKWKQPYVCKFCKKLFQCKSHVEAHITKHTKEKRYKCTFCGELFCTKTHAKCHVQNHVGWKCDKCSKYFVNKKRLTMHSCPNYVKNNKLTRDAAAYDFQLNDMIEFIGSCTTIKTNDNVSKNNHLFVCQFCNKKFKHKSWLDDHLTVHTKEKRYKCLFCGGLFCTKFDARLHVQHNCKFKHWKCYKCSKTFVDVKALTMHGCRRVF